LNIGVHTVKTHVHNVLEKLDLGSRLELAAFTYSRGWARPIVSRHSRELGSILPGRPSADRVSFGTKIPEGAVAG
jgi:hypothetical protein